jgi:probable F420-dependent oxidoreductase
MVTTVLISPQRQTVLIAKQAAELALLSGNRFRMGIGTGWNDIEYEALNEDFTNRGRRQAEQVDLMRKLWSSDSLNYEGKYHRVSKASINPRPTKPVPIWFGGGAPVVLKRCARLGDGWMPLMGANDAAREALDFIKSERRRLGLETEGFGVQAQAQYAGGNPDRWKNHHDKWQALGATHLAIATHNAGNTNVDGHLNRISDYMHAVGENTM